MKVDELKGRVFILLNYNDSVMLQFVIANVHREEIASITHGDGSVSASFIITYVSSNEYPSSLYRVYVGSIK